MKKSSLAAVPFYICILSASFYGQQPVPTIKPQTDDNTVKITTSLIQLDVVVTDKKGNVVKGLQSGDFQVYQDGKLQTLTGLTYSNGLGRERDTSLGKDNRKEHESLLIPSDVRSKHGRIITFILDDGDEYISFGELNTMIESVKKFMDEQMQPDDRVAIYRTAPGASLIPIYTSNKAVLKTVLSRIHLPLIRETAVDPSHGSRYEGSLLVLKAAIERLTGLPGRKIVFLLSSDLPLIVYGPTLPRTNSEVVTGGRDIIDLAGRASMVINTLSMVGVAAPGGRETQIALGPHSPFAAPKVRGLDPRGLSLLADGTGGAFVHNNNFPEREISKILERQTAYYLLSYEPDDETFKGRKYHNIEVKLTRPDLKVDTRNGFVGRTNAEMRPVYKTPDSPLYQAMDSPLGASGMEIGLTVLHGNAATIGNYIRPLFHINGEDLTLTDASDGDKKVVLDVVGVTLDEKSKVADEFNRTYTTRIPKEAIPLVMKNGLDFSSDMSVKKPGVYSFRLAVRDNASKRLGSAADYVEIEDLKKGHFFISGLITTEGDENGQPLLPKARPANSAISLVATLSAPSIRQYEKGAFLFYTYTIYNAKIASETGAPNLTRQIRLFHNGKLILDVAETPIPQTVPIDPLRINDFGRIRILEAVEMGEFALQVIVRDKIANRVSSEWIDFEVIN